MTGPTANLALWLNTQSLSFAEGPYSAAPYFAPLTATQNGSYIVDIYYVNPTLSQASTWQYLDPTQFLAASILFGNRASFNTYVTISSYTALVDSFGPKLRFILVLNSSQLNTDLASAASVVAIFQANWTTTTAAPAAQLYSQINKELGNSVAPVPSYAGQISLMSGINFFAVSGLGLSITPFTYIPQVLKSGSGDDNVTASLRQGFGTDGFTIDFNEPLPNGNYILTWQAVYAQ
jgi:hypothetical protein